MPNKYLATIVVILSVFGDHSKACSPSKELGASFNEVVKSSENIALGKVSEIVEIVDENGDGTQISRFEVVKDYRHAMPAKINVISKYFKGQDIDTSGLYKCNFSYRFKVGGLYLFSPNFLLPNSFIKVQDSVQADKVFENAKNESNSIKYFHLSQPLKLDSKTNLGKLTKLIANCSGAKKESCKSKDISFFLAGEGYFGARMSSDPEVGEAIYRFLTLPNVYSEAEKEYYEQNVLILALTQRNFLISQARIDKKKQGKKVKSNLERILSVNKLKIFINGIDQTKRYLDEIQ